MKESLIKLLQGYKIFREKYVLGDDAIMHKLAHFGQKPQAMVIACSDSRVDPALILQCEPGELFVVRNVANIVPPYEKDEMHHGTSAALEFGLCFLHIKHLILLGHSQCGGIQALLEGEDLKENDFINNWVSIIKDNDFENSNIDDYSKVALNKSYENCLTFPWINNKIVNNQLTIHRWFFDIKTGQIFSYCETDNNYIPLEVMHKF